MKKLIYGIFIICLSIGVVKAQEYNYEVCETCTYTNLSDVSNDFMNLSSLKEGDVININIKNGTYNNSQAYFDTNINEKIKVNIQGEDIDKTIINLNNRNIYFTSNIYSSSVSNLTINSGSLYLSNANISLKDLKINSSSTNTINIDNNCNYFVPENIEIDNITLNNSSSSSRGIYYNAGYGTGHKISVRNSILNAPFSVYYRKYLDSEFYGHSCYGIDFKELDKGILDHQIYVENSEINKVYAYDRNDTERISVLLSTNNTFNEGVDRETTLLEEEHGKIVLELKKQFEININDDLNKLVLEYFNENDASIDLNTLSYTIKDESIVKYEDGKFIPLKAGVTDIIVKNGNTQYVLNVTIKEKNIKPEENSNTEDEKNPNTNDVIYIIFAAVIVSLLFMIVARSRKFDI